MGGVKECRHYFTPPLLFCCTPALLHSSHSYIKKEGMKPIHTLPVLTGILPDSDFHKPLQTKPSV